MSNSQEDLQGVGRVPLGFEAPRGRTLPRFPRRKMKLYVLIGLTVAASAALFGLLTMALVSCLSHAVS